MGKPDVMVIRTNPLLCNPAEKSNHSIKQFEGGSILQPGNPHPNPSHPRPIALSDQILPRQEIKA